MSRRLVFETVYPYSGTPREVKDLVWHMSCTSLFVESHKEVLVMKRTALASLVALSFVAAAAAQQTRTPPGNDRTNQVSFSQADRDGDGKVSAEEGNAINGFDFSRADTNDDRTLTKQEYDAAMARSTPRGDGKEGPLAGDRTDQATFDQADKNHDGKISRDEAEDIDGFDFSAADADDDRWLSREEFRTAMSDSRPRG
jgi:hypothetical protein